MVTEVESVEVRSQEGENKKKTYCLSNYNFLFAKQITNIFMRYLTAILKQ